MARLHEKILRRLARPLYPPYYRFLFGRSFPGATALERWVGRYEEISGRGDVPLERADWEEQYARGDWEFLTGDDERERYLRLAGLLREHAPLDGRVLDVGCGEGLLLGHLAAPPLRYTGIDLSAVAVEKAEGRFGPGLFRAADAETFAPDAACGAIVLNECLYYFRAPIPQAERYFSHLVPGGILLVSMFRTPRTDALARLLRRRLPLSGETEIAGRTGRWALLAFRRGAAEPRRGAAV